MIEIGRLCIKIAGRDAGKKCVVVEIIDDNYVTIDGSTRRRNCNIKHLEPLDGVLKLKSGASHSDVASEFKKLNLVVWETKAKNAVPRPTKQRKVKVKEPKPKAKKPVKIAENIEQKKEFKSAEKPKEEKKPEVKLSKPKIEKQATLTKE